MGTPLKRPEKSEGKAQEIRHQLQAPSVGKHLFGPQDFTSVRGAFFTLTTMSGYITPTNVLHGIEVPQSLMRWSSGDTWSISRISGFIARSYPEIRSRSKVRTRTLTHLAGAAGCKLTRLALRSPSVVTRWRGWAPRTHTT